MPWIGCGRPSSPAGVAGEAQSLSAELTNNLVSSAQRTELLSLVTEAGERALLAWDLP